MAPLVKEHGAAKVYQAGLAALGYPPTWVDLGSEVLTVRKSLIQKGKL
jgi:hypothetical protein